MQPDPRIVAIGGKALSPTLAQGMVPSIFTPQPVTVKQPTGFFGEPVAANHEQAIAEAQAETDREIAKILRENPAPVAADPRKHDRRAFASLASQLRFAALTSDLEPFSDEERSSIEVTRGILEEILRVNAFRVHERTAEAIEGAIVYCTLILQAKDDTERDHLATIVRAVATAHEHRSRLADPTSPTGIRLSAAERREAAAAAVASRQLHERVPGGFVALEGPGGIPVPRGIERVTGVFQTLGNGVLDATEAGGEALSSAASSQPVRGVLGFLKRHREALIVGAVVVVFGAGVQLAISRGGK